MKKKMRGVGLLVLMLSCGVVSLAEETTPPPTDPICFGTGLINGGLEIEITSYRASDSACGTDVVIPAEIDGKPVTSIGDSAFYRNQLTSVVIPDSVKSIGGSAFYINELTSVVISDGVESIGNAVFANNKLTSVVIPDSVKSIGGSAFYGNQLTSVVILGSVTSIGEQAFSHNPLTSIVIPDSLTKIEWGAFNKSRYESIYTGVTIGILSKEKEFDSIIVERKEDYIKLVKFDLDGGTGTISIACEGTGCSVTSVPIKTGYNFSGWSEGLKVWNEDLSAWNTGDQTITAQWNPDPSSSSSSSSSS